VEPALLEEWGLSQPGLEKRWDAADRSAAAKGWRWIGEMEEIAKSFRAAGLPDGFGLAAADVYRALEGFKDSGRDPSLDEVIAALARTRAPARDA
jgi:hypothetical protein